MFWQPYCQMCVFPFQVPSGNNNDLNTCSKPTFNGPDTCSTCQPPSSGPDTCRTCQPPSSGPSNCSTCRPTSSGPKTCSTFQPLSSLHSTFPRSDVIQIEVGFVQLLSHPTQIYTVQNYDGSKCQTVVTRRCDGTETRSELRTSQTGELQRRDIKINQLNPRKAGMLDVHFIV